MDGGGEPASAAVKDGEEAAMAPAALATAVVTTPMEPMEPMNYSVDGNVGVTDPANAGVVSASMRNLHTKAHLIGLRRQIRQRVHGRVRGGVPVAVRRRGRYVHVEATRHVSQQSPPCVKNMQVRKCCRSDTAV